MTHLDDHAPIPNTGTQLHPLITQRHIDAFQRDGVALIRGLFDGHVDTIRAGIEENLVRPGQYAAENLLDGENGRFFDDYCNWSRISAFESVIRNSPVATVAADLMGSQRVQLFHDHVLIKEPGTTKPTPWHQDAPYYFVDGVQNVSFWAPLDPVSSASSALRRRITSLGEKGFANALARKRRFLPIQ